MSTKVARNVELLQSLHQELGMFMKISIFHGITADYSFNCFYFFS